MQRLKSLLQQHNQLRMLSRYGQMQARCTDDSKECLDGWVAAWA